MPMKYAWPIKTMLEWYTAGLTCVEIAECIGQVVDQRGELQDAKEGAVKKVLRKIGCKMRGTGASGKRNGSWKGGKRITKDGYVEIRLPDHPRSHASGYVFEHILVAEEVLGRPLNPGEVVHHDDENKANNAPDNLVVYASSSDHLKATRQGRRPNWTAEGWKRLLAKRRARAAKERAARASRKPAPKKLPKGIHLGDIA